LTIKRFAMIGILVLNLAAWITARNALPAQPPWLPFGVTPGDLLLQLGLCGQSLLQKRTIPKSGDHGTRVRYLPASGLRHLMAQPTERFQQNR